MSGFWRVLAPAVLLAALAGCGGGGGASSSATGEVKVALFYPENLNNVALHQRGRSVTVTVRQGTATLASRTIAIDPTTEVGENVVLDNLPKARGEEMEIAAYASQDGSGPALVSRRFPIYYDSSNRSYHTVSLGTPLRSLGAPRVAVGGTFNLCDYANSDWGDLMIYPGTIVWLSDNPDLVAVDTNGVVTALHPTGLSPRTATVKALDLRTNAVVAAAIEVTSSTKISLPADTVTLAPGQSTRLSATVTDAPDTTVDWSVREGAAGGTITSDGTYTAPSQPGIYTVVASSHYDSARYVEVHVHVQ